MSSPGQSEASIYNLVLDKLSEGSVLGPDDDRAVVRWLRRNYAPTRDQLLAQHPWNFAVRRKTVAADTTTPAFEWRYQYTRPTDCIRVLPLTADGTRNGPPAPFVIEGAKILTNLTAPLKMRYIARIEDVPQFSPHFLKLLVHTLSAEAAHWMTGKQALAKALVDSLPSTTMNAQLIDSLEGSPEEPADDDPILVR